MKKELQNWIKLSVILSVILIAAIEASASTSEVSEALVKGAHESFASLNVEFSDLVIVRYP